MHPKASGLDRRGGCGAWEALAELTAGVAVVAEKVVVAGLTVGQQDFVAEEVEDEGSDGGFSHLHVLKLEGQLLSLGREV